MKRPRIFQQMYAFLHSYFWLPCPLCGQHFGGHEWLNEDNSCILSSWDAGQGVCPDCTRNGAAKAYNDRFDDVWREPYPPLPEKHHLLKT